MFRKLWALLRDIRSYKENRNALIMWALFFVMLPIVESVLAKQRGILSDTSICSGLFGNTIVGLCWLVFIIKRFRRTKTPESPEPPVKTNKLNGKE